MNGEDEEEEEEEKEEEEKEKEKNILTSHVNCLDVASAERQNTMRLNAALGYPSFY